MNEAKLKEMVLKALQGGVVGTVGEIRNLTPGAGFDTPLPAVLSALQELESDGSASCAGEVWRSTKGVHLSGHGEDAGTQMRSLAYVPTLVPSSYLHLSYRAGSRSFRLRNYSSGAMYFVDVPEAENDVDALRRLFPFEDERVWPDEEARPVEDVAYWAEQTEKANKLIPKSIE